MARFAQWAASRGTKSRNVCFAEILHGSPKIAEVQLIVLRTLSVVLPVTEGGGYTAWTLTLTSFSGRVSLRTRRRHVSSVCVVEGNMDKQQVSRARARGVLILAVLLVLSACASVFRSHASFGASEHVQYVQIPLHAEEILRKCAALELKPQPPPGFHERSQSDRFQHGTRPLLIRNATLWTGLENGFDVVQGDVYLDRGLIRAIGRVSTEILEEDVTIVEANGCVYLFQCGTPILTVRRVERG